MWFCDLPFTELVWDARVKEHFWLPDQMPKPRPGSVVTVPLNDGLPKRDIIPLITGLLQIIGSTVAIIVAVTR